MKTALIAGATGLVGSELLKFLLAENSYDKVISVGRSKTSLSHPKLEQIIVDFNNLLNYKDQLKADDVFCCLGTTMKKAGSKEKFARVDYTYPVNLALITKSNDARQYLLVTAMGADNKSLFFYNRVKGEVEQDVSEVGFDSTLIFRPSLILGDRNEKRFGEDFAKALAGPFSFLLSGPMKKFKPIKARQIAEGMVKIAQKKSKGVHIIESEDIKKI